MDSPQYQLNNLNPGAVISWAKSIAWAFTTDSWSAGEFSLISDCFSKVNDDTTKLYNTGAVVQRSVIWQMENGCPFMLSWNLALNVGFVSALDNDVIAHEKTVASAVDGIFCAFQGGAGSLNNWLFENTRLESFQYSLFSVMIA